MKRTISLLIIIVSIISMLTACSSEPVAGEDLILAARQAYTELDSARVDVVNDDTGESEQIFIFKYDEKNIMTYSYIGSSGDTYLAQYNNGYEQFTVENGVLSALYTSDADFAAYSRDVPYPLADEGLILFYKTAVNRELSYIATNELATEVCHVYDISKLGDADAPDGMSGFSVKYYFDGEGKLLYFKEITTLEVGGEIKTYSYTIYITEQNSVATVSNPIDISSLSDNLI